MRESDWSTEVLFNGWPEVLHYILLAGERAKVGGCSDIDEKIDRSEMFLNERDNMSWCVWVHKVSG